MNRLEWQKTYFAVVLGKFKSRFSINIKVRTMEKLSFYDVKAKAKFDSDNYDIREKNGRYFAVTKSQSGPHECWRVLSKADGERLKGK